MLVARDIERIVLVGPECQNVGNDCVKRGGRHGGLQNGVDGGILGQLGVVLAQDGCSGVQVMHQTTNVEREHLCKIGFGVES